MGGPTLLSELGRCALLLGIAATLSVPGGWISVGATGPPGGLGLPYAPIVPGHAHPNSPPVDGYGARTTAPSAPLSRLSGAPSNARPAAPTPLAAVNPLAFYKTEPAPMGIADYGVTGVGAGSRAYEYSTLSFEALASIQAMNVSVAVTAFELNAMVVLRSGGTNYTYWIQNGLHVGAASRQFTIGGAYVWNFSASGARLSSSELRGANGSVLATDTYYYIPGCNGLPGQCSTLSWPTTIVGRVNASLVGGIPVVAYAYDLGSGWVTYDTVSFVHMAGASLSGFVVDGYAPTPYSSGLFYDAEWDWVAAGGGSTMIDRGSNLSMSLSFWNGRNYQGIPTAWDFGGDTGETSSNVTVSLGRAIAGGGVSARLSPGPGTLGVLYNRSEVGYLNVTSPTVPQGTLDLGGTRLPFPSGGLNLTVASGQYSLSLLNYSNTTETVTVVPGGTTYVNLSGAGWTTFEESGLPSGTPWGLTVGGASRSATTPAISFTLPNGTFPVSYAAVPGFHRNSTAPLEVTVPSATRIPVDWSLFTYLVPVNESGLPAGTVWWVTVGARVVRGAGPGLDVAAPNGSTPFTVASAYKFVANPSQGTIDVTAGEFVPIDVLFTYRPTFIAGTVSPANAQVTVGDQAASVDAGNFNVSVIPGNYTLVANASGYVSRSIPVVATPGNVTLERIVLDQQPSNNSTGGAGTPTGGPISPTLLVVLVAALVTAAGVAAFAVMRRRRSGDAPPPPSEAGEPIDR